MSLTDDINDMLTPVLDELGFRLWDIKVTKAGKRSIVSVTLDKHNGATLEDISQASKEIAPVLDELPSLEDSYHLEVSSPGLERSLLKQDHYVWSLGMQITVSFRSEGTVIRKSGKLVSVDTKNIQIEEDDETITIEIENITKAHTLFNFEEALKKGPISEELQGESA